MLSDDLYVFKRTQGFVQSTVMYAKVPDEALDKRHDTPDSSRGSYDGSIVTTQMLFNRLKALARVGLPEPRALASRSEAVKDFYDYNPEVERPLKAGDRRRCVLRFDHVLRNPVLAERGEKGLLATRMASPNLPRGWRKPRTPTVTADRASKTRSRCARIESANRTAAKPSPPSFARAVGCERSRSRAD